MELLSIFMTSAINATHLSAKGFYQQRHKALFTCLTKQIKLLLELNATEEQRRGKREIGMQLNMRERRTVKKRETENQIMR